MSERPTVAEARAVLERVLTPTIVDAIEELVGEEVREALVRIASRPSWLTLEEAAERYKTTPAALRKRAQRGQLAGAVKDGARWLVDANALDASLERATIASAMTTGGHRANGPAPA
jgi:Helix-turn-helix domain